MFLNQRTFVFVSIVIVVFGWFGTAKALNYRSYVFNTYEMILFSYEDETELAVYRYGNPVYSKVLDKGEHDRVFLSGVGAYEVAGSNRFAVLIGDAAVLVGDAAAQGRNGYYAMDQNGKGVSTEFYTFVPPKTQYYGYQKFVVFAYEDGTQITVEKDQGNGNYQAVVTNHALDDGQHWKKSDITEWSGKYVHVTANKPVSALSCYDTGYFVPSANGTRPEMSMCAYL